MQDYNCYKALFNQNHRQAFGEYTQALSVEEVDYFAIGFQDTINQKSCSFMSNLDWQKTFKAQDFAPYDPVRKAALGSTRHFFSFDQIDYCDNLGKEIMRQRKRFGMLKGLVIMERHLGYNYMMTLATGYTNFDAFDFYMRHTKDLKIILSDLKKLLASESKHLMIAY